MQEFVASVGAVDHKSMTLEDRGYGSEARETERERLTLIITFN